MPCDAFLGGRIKATRLLYKVEPGEKIRYYNVTSEHPYVNKYKVYSIGGHIRITENFGDVRKYCGLIKGSIVPPGNLFLPALPSHVNGKLVFALCRTCASDQANGKCAHLEEECIIHGTFCSLELHAALDRGYVLKNIEVVRRYEHNLVI